MLFRDQRRSYSLRLIQLNRLPSCGMLKGRGRGKSRPHSASLQPTGRNREAAVTLSRRTFCGAAAGAGVLSIAPTKLAFAQTAEFRLKYGTAFPVDHPGAVRIKEAAESIKTETNGRVEILVFPNSQLGSEPDMFAQTRSGALEFMSTSGVNLTTVSVGGINAVAFAFNDYNQVWAAMDGELGAYVRAAFEKANLYLFEKCLDNGFRNMTSSARPINTPEDLKGLKIRVPSNQRFGYRCSRPWVRLQLPSTSMSSILHCRPRLLMVKRTRSLSYRVRRSTRFRSISP